MNELISPVASIEPAGPAYKDRSTGLMVFGIMTIVLGGLTGLMALLMLVMQFAATKSVATSASHLPGILMPMAMYGATSVALIWLGVGSIKARRWARALLLIFSWTTIVMGVFVLGMTLSVMPVILKNGSDQGHMETAAVIGIVTSMCLFAALFLIVLPAVWVFFYNQRDVKATCEARDNVVRWTDACPLPVLALALWLVLSVPMFMMSPLMERRVVVPFFGIFLFGAVGVLFYLVNGVLWCWAAWLVYRVKSIGWWLILMGMIVFTVSGLVTSACHSPLEMYQLMGYSQEEIDQIKKTGLLTGGGWRWLTALTPLLVVIYMLFIKRYFPARRTETK